MSVNKSEFVRACTLITLAICTIAAPVRSQDCNSNGIPDACDLNCGTPGGACDLPGCGLRADCNSNGIPDDCEGPPPTTRNAVHRGWWRSDGFHDSFINNTFTGRVISSGLILNTYFIFDLSGLGNPSIATLRLEIHGYFGSDPSETITVYDVSTPAATLEASGTDIGIFNDLGSGNVYATFVVRPSDVGTVLEIPLNSQAIADIRNSSGFFSVGLRATTLNLPSGDEGVRFSNANESRVHQLVLRGFIDCNLNGTLDECDIDAGFSDDCDSNGIPDECDVDCNSNGTPDPCDTASGTSLDCNANMIPDECESDCNSNGIPDDCDIVSGTSPDCNSNAIPDECDISSGTFPDCNQNDIPDACDLASGVSPDCNSDGVPDDCQLAGNDCNTNNTPDDCDVDGGFSEDCDFNFIPDECDPDCDSNGVPDACDVAEGAGADCNGNGILDACELQDGSSTDCDQNGIPDECDIATGGLQVPARIAYFFDSLYVDEISGATRMRSALVSRGHYVSSFTGATGAQWTAALASADVVVLPEMDGPDLYNAMDAAARTALQNFVLNGGGLVQAYCRGTGTNDLNLINGLFGTTLATCSAVGGPYNIDSLAAGATIFAGGPSSLSSPTDTNSLIVSQLPPGARAIYSNGLETSLVTWSAGFGDITWLGFNFDQSSAPPEWIEVVDRACSIRRSKDCNANSILDTCEISAQPSLDCDGNGVIDDCGDPDCNSNGVADACDVTEGFSTDCNSNAVPDECDIARKGTSSPADIAFFFDATYVDEFGEAVILRDTLAGRGHIIITFVGTSTAAWQAALTGVDAVVVPQLDGPDLLAAMSMGARSALMSFVENGGTFIQAYSRSGTTIDLGLLNALFGASLTTCDSFGGPVLLDPLAAVGTPFVGGPAILPALTDTNSLLVAQLPPDAKAVYSNGTQTTLVTWQMGLGRVTWLGSSYGVQPGAEWVEVADRAARITGSGDCNSNGIPDECEIAGGLSDDCDVDGTPDECEDDCNSNGINDECDIGSGAIADCNANAIPDDCELAGNDCDANGIPDECEPDCNSNGLADACDISSGTSLDCQQDGIPDECQTVGVFVSSSGTLSPIDASNPRTHVFENPPPAIRDVTIRFFASGDLSGFDEYISVSLNGTSQGVVFQSGGLDCTAMPLMAQFILTSTAFNALIAGGNLTVAMTPTSAVTPGTCSSPSIRVELSYESPGLLDCDSNGVPDSCDIANTPSLDCDHNGVIDDCDEFDCNSNGISDPCDIESGTSLDCNANSVPDECDILDSGPKSRGTIALFFDPIFVDELTEARQLREALEGSGYSVATFTGTFGPLWTAALASADTVVIPELDGPDLYISLDTAARNALRDFVLGGGSFVQAYARTSGTVDVGMLNNLFGANVTTVGIGNTSTTLNSAAAMDTPFAGGPSILPPSNDINTITTAQLPAIARAVYASGTNASVATWKMGFGRVTWLGFDFFETPVPAVWIDVLDRAALAPGPKDCNNNGIPDTCDLASGSSQDCDSNGIPDDCQADCNTNGVNDVCEIAAGTQPDCNNNDIPDSCDVANGSSDDCNTDGIPDDCQADCNANGIADTCDIANGLVEDCNADGVPDICQIVTSTVETFTGGAFSSQPPVTWTNFVRGPGWFFNNISPIMVGQVLQSAPVTASESTAINATYDFGPSGGNISFNWAIQSQSSSDFLRFDVDGVNMLTQSATTSGTSSFLISPGVHVLQWRYDKNSSTSTGTNGAAIDNVMFQTSSTAGDCNTNGLLDACDIALDPMIDCDQNGVIDVCGDPDCNSNGIGDPCDILAGFSQDCDSNGIPDECDVVLGLPPVAGRVAFFFDTIYVDDFTEARLFRDALIGRGHTVTTFTGITGPAWAAALADAEVLVVPEVDGPDLFAAMSASARMALLDFVYNGGSLVQSYCRESNTIDLGILNGVLGASLTTCNSFGGPTFLDTSAASGTVFEGGPVSVPASSETNSLVIAQLPPGARAIYHNGALTTLATWDVGAGHVTWIGYDFTTSPTPANWLEVADRASRIRRTADCNLNGVPDSCDVASGSVADCDSDGVPDDCELDCNSNGINDDCDVSEMTSADCNTNGMPDECELTGNDCNSNAILDDCEPDCNGNGIVDACDIQAGASQDCQPDGVPDECQTVGSVSITSPSLSPIDSGAPQNFVIASPQQALSDVALFFEANADLLDTSEFLTISLNGSAVGTVFQTGGMDCQFIVASAPLVVPQVAFNAAAETGTVTINIVASSAVNPGVCVTSFVRVRVEYLGSGVADCNTNGIPDDCDIATSPSLDCDSNGVIDFCGDPDCNSNGVADACDISAGSSEDCNTNGVPDECDLASDETFTAIHRGWWPSQGQHESTNNNTFTGHSASSVTNSYFIFLLTDGRSVNQATLRLEVEGYFGIDPFETITVYDVSTAPAVLEASGTNPAIFEDLQSGTVYATFNVTPADVGQILEIPLNPSAVSDMGAASGFFAVGLHASTISLIQTAEGVRFSGGSEPRVHELVVFRNYDCDSNGILDACEIEGNDCNSNGILDACDITDGASPDCDSNGVPDACDIVAHDCNTNGIPDACDILSGASQDVDTNGIPDDCELDVHIGTVIRQTNPGQDASAGLPASDPTIAPGSTFFVELWASDLGQQNTGLVGLFVDLAFTPGRFEVLNIDHRPPFTLLAGGMVNNAMGTVTGLGGNDGTFSCTGISPMWVRVAVLECRALPDFCAQGLAVVSLAPSTNEVSACGRGAVPPQQQQLGTSSVSPGIDCVYDKTGDAFVNAGDLGLFAGHWLTGTGHPNYDPQCDFDCSGFIAAGDLGWFATAWLQSCDALTLSDLPPCRRCAVPQIIALNNGLDAFHSMIGEASALSAAGSSSQAPSPPDQVILAQRFVRQPALEEIITSNVLPAGDTRFRAGERLYAEIWVRDETADSRGMTAVYVDAAFNPAQVLIGSVQHGATFSMLGSGAMEPGRIARLGGATLEADVAVRRWTRVAVVELTALVGLPAGPGFEIVPSVDGVSAIGRGTVSVTQSRRPQSQFSREEAQRQ